MSSLSYFSTLQDLISASDDELRKGIGSLNPDKVTEYVFHLRAELALAASPQRSNQESLPPSAPPPLSVLPPPASLNYYPTTSKQPLPLSISPENQPFVLLSGTLANVRISKVNEPGKGYFLTCHSDKRNNHSTWALAHRPRDGDKDNYWNIIPWQLEGVICYKIEKANERNRGMMLTAHTNKRPNSDIRALVHKANHNVPDECWGFVPHGDPSQNNYTIVKALNRNKKMVLIAREARNTESCWVDVSNFEGDVWKIERQESESSSSTNVFPEDTCRSVWTWAHNGTIPNGIIEFLADGGTKWYNGQRQGSWKLKQSGTLLKTEFNGVHHELFYCAAEKKAVLKSPVRNPPSVMWIQGERGEFPFGRQFHSNKISLLGHHNVYLGADNNGNLSCNEECSTNDVIEVLQIKPSVVALKSEHGKYLSAQPNGTLEWNRAAANIWEFFTVSQISEHKISLKSFHGKYVSAQPDGRMEVNRDSVQAWEHLTMTDSTNFSPIVTLNSNDVFPEDTCGSVWTWAHNGTTPNGIIEFLADGGTKWFNGQRQGSWKLKQSGTILETEFNGVHHELFYCAAERKAVLKSPVRNPPSVMWIQGERGEFPFGRQFHSNKISLLGHHNVYLGADNNGNLSCNEECSTNDVIEVLQIKPSVVALTSKHGKYLSAQPNGTLEWNRAAANIWEFFTVSQISEHKISLKSFHGKYISAQPDGRMEVNRDRVQAWEHFYIS